MKKITLAASERDLCGGDRVVALNFGNQTRHALVQNAMVIDESAMRLVTVKAQELRIGIADGEVFCELDVGDQVRLLPLILWINRERGIT